MGLSISNIQWRKNATFFTIIIAVIALFFSVTNLVSISASMFLLFIFIPILLYRQKSITNITLLLGILFLYYIWLIILYHPSSLYSLSFYRRDGNVFITFFPLFIISLVKVKLDLRTIFQSFLIFAACINLVLLVIFAITGGSLFLYENNIFHSLFIAHNAAGGFFAMMSAFSLGLLLKKRNLLNLAVFSIHLIALWLTDSRGSVAALFIAVFIGIFDMKKYWHKTIVISLFIAQVLLAGWVFHMHYTKGVTKNNAPKILGHRADTLNDRLFNLWPRAIYLFTQSPLIGTGFGSYNDVPYKLEGIPHLYMQNKPEDFHYDAAHAHHSFYHVLAETGIVGLILLLLFLSEVRKYLLTIKDSWVGSALFLAFWVAILSSFTEHRLFTPSQMLPFTILLGLSIAGSRYENTQKTEAQILLAYSVVNR